MFWQIEYNQAGFRITSRFRKYAKSVFLFSSHYFVFGYTNNKVGVYLGFESRKVSPN